MTPAERTLWLYLQRRAGVLSPELGQAILRAFAKARDSMTDEQIIRALARGGPEQLFREILSQALLDVAFQPVRERLRRTIAESVRYTATTLPLPPSSSQALAIGFDILSPRVITAIRTLETRVIGDLSSGIRETIRAYVEQGLREGLGPRDLARDLRAYIGIPPSRELWIRNYEEALRSASTSTKALGYELRDKRFDVTVMKARRDGVSLTEAQIEKMVGSMRRKTIVYSAETVSRTATLDALKLGQRLSWEAAAESGVLDRGRLFRRWVGVMDKRERPSHVAMQDEVAQFDQPYSNGQMVPGDDEYNCRCVESFYVT